MKKDIPKSTTDLRFSGKSCSGIPDFAKGNELSGKELPLFPFSRKVEDQLFSSENTLQKKA